MKILGSNALWAPILGRVQEYAETWETNKQTHNSVKVGSQGVLHECLDRTFCASAFSISRFPRFSFFLFFGTRLGDNFHCYGYCSWTVAAQFDFSALFNTTVGPVHCSRDSHTSLFNNLFIKNESHGTIHTFKNYFDTMFFIFNFQFQQNKFYLNRPYIIIILFFLQATCFIDKGLPQILLYLWINKKDELQFTYKKNPKEL